VSACVYVCVIEVIGQRQTSRKAQEDYVLLAEPLLVLASAACAERAKHMPRLPCIYFNPGHTLHSWVLDAGVLSTAK
jgi:hypothetical protein